MAYFFAGLTLVGLWILLQFVWQYSSGFIHLLLALGVLSLIKGITRSRWANHGEGDE